MGFATEDYGHGTSVTRSFPFGLYIRARVMCSDGTVRATHRLASTADTFFSVPCAVKVKGRTVAGYLTIETADGCTPDKPGDPSVVKFVAVTYRKNHDALPDGAWIRNPAAVPVK